VPVAFIVAGCFLSRGPLRAQLLQLNSGILCGGVVLIAYYIYRGQLFDVGVPFSFFFLVLLATGASMGLVIVRAGGRLIRGWTGRSRK
jgi:hypothetical protein